MYTVAFQKIAQAHSIFMTSHQDCPDAIGSLCTLIDFFRKEGKTIYPYLSNAVPKHLRDLHCSEEIVIHKPNFQLYDLFLIVDVGDLKQTNLEKELTPFVDQPEKYCVVTIDHHQTNHGFGHVNIIDKEASSTCEMLYHLLGESAYTITHESADCLLTGIMSDTSNFTNAATTENTFKIAADLIWHGANIFKIIQRLFSVEESINTLRLWGIIFERLTYNPKYDIAASYVLQKDLQGCNSSEEGVEVVANLLNYISGIKAGVLVKEKRDGTAKVSLRSTYPGVDVSYLAKLCGGGGHKKAAGFSVERLTIDI